MNRPPSTPPPPTDPPADPPEPIEGFDEPTMTLPTGWGLSRAQAKELINAMRGMIIAEGCPVNLHEDALQDAFVMASCKPISERPPVTEWKRFVSWMCTLAKYAAWTNRNKEHRRRERDERLGEELAELLSVPEHVRDIVTLEALEHACTQLEPEDQALIKAHYYQGKTIQEIAKEEKKPWTTMKSRLHRVLDLLRDVLPPIIVALVLLVAKNARAQGARLARHVSLRLPHGAQMACAMTVTVACGVLVPANSMATMVRQDALASAPLVPPDTPITVSIAPTAQPVEVALVKPIGLDEPDAQWSDSSMKSIKIASHLQAIGVPFAFVVALAMPQLGCAGGERQTPPPQQPDEGGYEGGVDPYEHMCDNERRRGNDCPSKAEWYRQFGYCPDGTKGCQE